MLKKVITLAMLAVAAYGYAQKNGSAVDWDLAQRLIQNFETSATGITHRHYYGKTMLDEMLLLNHAQTVHVFNGLDGDGVVHLIFKVTDQDDQIINKSYAFDSGTPCPPYCPDENKSLKDIGGELEEGKAQQWVANFQDKYPNRPTVFSFSREEFVKVLSAKGAEGMVLSYGLEDGAESMILCAFDTGVVSLWDNPLALAYGEKNCALYPVQKMVKN